MTDLTDYAKRAYREWSVTDEGMDAAGSKDHFVAGILHLAEQLQRKDVIEAGSDALPVLPGADNPEHYRSVMRDCLAAMLAKIAEGAAS